MKLLVTLILFVVSVVLCSKCVVEKVEVADEGEMIFYDSDEDSNHEVPPPPGSEYFKTRKRVESLSFTRKNVETFGAKKLFCRPEYFETIIQEGRNDSDETVDVLWEGFAMDQDDLNGTRHNSAESTERESPEIKLRKKFSKTRSESFTIRRTARLPSHSEDQEEEIIS